MRDRADIKLSGESLIASFLGLQIVLPGRPSSFRARPRDQHPGSRAWGWGDTGTHDLPADGLRTKLLVQCHGEAKEAAVLSPLDDGLGDIQVEGGIPPEAKAEEEAQEAKVQRPRHPARCRSSSSSNNCKASRARATAAPKSFAARRPLRRGFAASCPPQSRALARPLRCPKAGQPRHVTKLPRRGNLARPRAGSLSLIHSGVPLGGAPRSHNKHAPATLSAIGHEGAENWGSRC